MALISSLSQPVTLTDVNRSVLLDNFTGSYAVASTTPQITVAGVTWDLYSTGSSASGVVSSANLVWAPDVSIGQVTGLTDWKLDVGYITPISAPPDDGAEYRTKLSVAGPSGTYFIELLRISQANPSATKAIGFNFRPYTTTYFGTTYLAFGATGTWVSFIASLGNDDPGGVAVQFVASNAQMPDDISLNSAYKLTIETDELGARFLINDVQYASISFPVVYVPGRPVYVSLTDSRVSYPGSGGVVNLGGFDSVRLAPLIIAPRPKFWGRNRGTKEVTG